MTQEESFFDDNKLFESRDHQLKEQIQRSKQIKSWVSGKIHKFIDFNNSVQLEFSKNNLIKQKRLKKKVRKMRILSLFKSVDYNQNQNNKKIVMNSRDYDSLYKFEKQIKRHQGQFNPLYQEIKHFLSQRMRSNYKIKMITKSNSRCNNSFSYLPTQLNHLNISPNNSFLDQMSFSESIINDYTDFETYYNYYDSDDIYQGKIQQYNTQSQQDQYNVHSTSMNYDHSNPVLLSFESSQQGVINSQQAYNLFKLFITKFEHVNNIVVSDQEGDLITQLKQIIDKYNYIYEFDELFDLFTLILEDKDDLLLKLFSHLKTHTIMIYLIDCVVKKRYSLVDGMYNISLCKTDCVDYINDFYEKENHVSMVINSLVFNNKFMHPNAGFDTEFQIKAYNDSMYEMTFYDTSLNKPRNQPLGQFYDSEIKILQLTIKKQQHDKFFIEYMYDDQQIIVYKMSTEINYNNIDKLTNQYILAYNIEMNTFESVNLEVAMFREESKQMFLFKFNRKDICNHNQKENKLHDDKVKAQTLLDSIYQQMINQGLNFFKHKHCCTIYRRFAEFMSFNTNFVAKEHFTLLLSNKDQINVILEYYEGTQIYLTLISRKFQQFFYKNIKLNLMSFFHQYCQDTELHALNFNTPNEFQVNLFLKYVFDNISKYGLVRNITILVEQIVKQINQSLIKDTYMFQILENFDSIVGSQEGIRTEGLRVFSIVLSKLPERSLEFEKSMQLKILSLGCAKDMSIMIQKLIEMEENIVQRGPFTSNVDYFKQAVQIKTVVLKIVTQDYENSTMDPVYVFMGDCIGNYVLQTIYKCAEQFEKVYGYYLYKQQILSKIQFQYLNQYKQKKNKQAKSIYKNQQQRVSTSVNQKQPLCDETITTDIHCE